MADFINTIDLLGDEVVAGMLVDKSITEFNDDILTETGYFSFTYCENLVSVKLPNVTNLLAQTFNYCSSLETVVLPKVTKIGSQAFQVCRKLKSVFIPSVTTIEDLTFTNCSSLESVTLPATPPTLASGAFGTGSTNNVPVTCVFHIPTGSLSAYQNATNWSAAVDKYNFVEEAQ